MFSHRLDFSRRFKKKCAPKIVNLTFVRKAIMTNEMYSLARVLSNSLIKILLTCTKEVSQIPDD